MGNRRLRLADINMCCVPQTNTQVRWPKLCSRWTAALEQSVGQDSPARQWHWRISSAAEVVFGQVTSRRIVTFWFYAPLNTLTHYHYQSTTITTTTRKSQHTICPKLHSKEQFLVRMCGNSGCPLRSDDGNSKHVPSSSSFLANDITTGSLVKSYSTQHSISYTLSTSVTLLQVPLTYETSIIPFRPTLTYQFSALPPLCQVVVTIMDGCWLRQQNK